jgi:hypothetical protein
MAPVPGPESAESPVCQPIRPYHNPPATRNRPITSKSCFDFIVLGFESDITIGFVPACCADFLVAGLRFGTKTEFLGAKRIWAGTNTVCVRINDTLHTRLEGPNRARLFGALKRLKSPAAVDLGG